MFNPSENEFVYLKPVLWSEVFDIWRSNEAGNPAWIKHFQSRGFKTWEEWRLDYAKPLQLEKRDWHLYKIQDPLVSVPAMFGGPNRTLRQTYYGGKDYASFSELVQNPHFENHPGYQKMLRMFDDFPGETTIIGLLIDQGITVIEGFHRGCALALAKLNDKKISTEVQIILTDARGEELPAIGMELKN